MTVKVNTVLEFFQKHKKVLIIALASVVIIATIVGAIAGVILPKEGRIAKGVSVGGVKLGGVTVEEARKLIDISGFYDGSFTISCRDEKITVQATDVELDVDEGKSALKAYEVGHSGSFGKRLLESVKLLTVGIDIPPSPILNTDILDMYIYYMGVELNGERQAARVEYISDALLSVYPPSRGQDSNVEQARATVLNALQNFGMNIDIPIELSVKEPEKMTVEDVYLLTRSEAVDATYAIEGKELIITDEVVGKEVDRGEIEQKLAMLNAGEPITLNVTQIVPQITAAGLKSDLFSTELASYTSKYSTATTNRAFNVARAADSVNGTILLPGEVFSYNSAIGNPSLANGYKVASVYENGKQTEGVGGGVCQVSSTIYSAVLYANLEIVERRSHSLTVGYVPKGQDATVSYGTLDFKFKNNTVKPIKVVVSAKGGICRAYIYGSKPDVARKVELSHSILSQSNPTDNITYNNDLDEGTRKVTSKGKTGYVVDSVRRVFENGVEVKSEKLTRSTYKMVPNEVTVGTKLAATPTPAPASTEEPVTTSKPVEATPAPLDEPIDIPDEMPVEEDIITE